MAPSSFSLRFEGMLWSLDTAIHPAFTIMAADRSLLRWQLWQAAYALNEPSIKSYPKYVLGFVEYDKKLYRLVLNLGTFDQMQFQYYSHAVKLSYLNSTV